MKKIAIYVTAMILFTGLSSCNKLDDDIDELSLHQDQNTTENVVAKIGSGVFYKPDATWIEKYSSGSKIAVFEKGSISTRTYVMAVDLSTGAKVLPYYEFASGHGNATYAIPSPSFQKKRVQDFNMSSLGWFGVVNFGFFGFVDQSSFLLRKNGTLVTAGYSTYSSDPNEGPRRTLAISGSSATVFEGPGYNSGHYYTLANSAWTGYSHVMTGMHPLNASKQKTSSIQRTFVGVKQKTPGTSGGSAYIYILASKSLTQQQAHDILVSFGCNSLEIVMFDGDGSTQMKVGDDVLITTSRSVPTFLAIKEY